MDTNESKGQINPEYVIEVLQGQVQSLLQENTMMSAYIRQLEAQMSPKEESDE